MAYCSHLLCWQYNPCARHGGTASTSEGASLSSHFADTGRAALFEQEAHILRQNAQAPNKKPAVMFVCIHNAGRSQMAQGFLQHYLGDKAVVCSSGSKPGDKVNAVAVEAMKEKGIDISDAFPKPLDSSRFGYLDRAVIMGCGDVCPVVPNVVVEDWKLEDPRGADLETVRGIRDTIEERVKVLCRELDPNFDAACTSKSEGACHHFAANPGRATLFDQEKRVLKENSSLGPNKKPAVMFVCIHNAGRSQMAQGFLQHYLGDKAVVCSSGSKPGDKVNEVAVEAMKEKGIDISMAYPKPLESDRFTYLDRAVTMGCGDVCPMVPNVIVEDWKLEDPRGADLETVRGIRDTIEERVKALCRELDPSFNY